MPPSFIITGFLGSGKTTLILNSVRSTFQDRKVAIIVNEFGEIGFDGRVLKNVYSEVIELTEGCICCSLTSQFEKGIKEIVENYSPDVLLVETSGVSEPFPVMFTLQSLGLSVEGVLCVIDVDNFPRYENSTTSKYQIGSSSILVLNKVDLVNEGELKEVESKVTRIRKDYALKNFFTGEEVFPKFVLVKTTYRKVPKEVFQFVPANKIYSSIHHSHEDESFYQRTIRFDKHLTYQELESYMRDLPQEVIRAKGIIKVEEVANPILVSYSFGNFEVLGEAPDYEGESFLVTISYQEKKEGVSSVSLNIL